MSLQCHTGWSTCLRVGTDDLHQIQFLLPLLSNLAQQHKLGIEQLKRKGMLLPDKAGKMRLLYIKRWSRSLAEPCSPFQPQTWQLGQRWRHYHDPRVSCIRLNVQYMHMRGCSGSFAVIGSKRPVPADASVWLALVHITTTQNKGGGEIARFTQHLTASCVCQQPKYQSDQDLHAAAVLQDIVQSIKA